MNDTINVYCVRFFFSSAEKKCYCCDCFYEWKTIHEMLNSVCFVWHTKRKLIFNIITYCHDLLKYTNNGPSEQLVIINCIDANWKTIIWYEVFGPTSKGNVIMFGLLSNSSFDTLSFICLRSQNKLHTHNTHNYFIRLPYLNYKEPKTFDWSVCERWTNFHLFCFLFGVIFYCSNFRLQFLLIYSHAVCAVCMCIYRFDLYYFILFFHISFPKRWFGSFNLFPFVNRKIPHIDQSNMFNSNVNCVVGFRVPYFNIDEAGIAIVDCMKNRYRVNLIM